MGRVGTQGRTLTLALLGVGRRLGVREGVLVFLRE